MDGWSEDLVQEYRNLKTPTLYDFAVSGEKLSYEVRKQNQELKNLQGTLEQFIQSWKQTEAQKTKIPSTALPTLQHQRSLMEAFDAIFLLKAQAEKAIRECFIPNSKKRHTIRKKQIEFVNKTQNILLSFLQGIVLVEEKFLSSLADSNMEPFCPEPGDPFSPKEHRAVLKQKSGPSGTIHKTVRVGFKQSNEILRFADVIINYQ